MQIEAQLRDGGGEERQPPPRKFVSFDEREVPQISPLAPSSQTLGVWTGQEPGERIANTILLCAIRDCAKQVTLEPSAKGVKVSFQIENGVREQKLPGFALAPIVRHFKALTRREHSGDLKCDEADNCKMSGEVRIAVDEKFYEVQFSPLPTQWGEGVTVRLSPQN